MPSRTTRRSVDGGVPDDRLAPQAATDKETHPPKQQERNKFLDKDVQLFAFDAEQGGTIREGRPKRKLKAVARFSSSSYDKAAHCKIGEGFTCPRCSAVCSYSDKKCDECQLDCYYEAGIGVVVLKERRVRVDHDKQHGGASPKDDATAPVTKPAGEATAASTSTVAASPKDNATAPVTKPAGEATAASISTERRRSYPPVKVGRTKKESKKKKRQSLPLLKTSSTYPTDESDKHIAAQPADGLPHGWVYRRLPRGSGNRSDPYWYSPERKFKFRSRPDAQRFVDMLGKANGDETAAIVLFKQRFGKTNSGSSTKKKATLADLTRKAGGTMGSGKKFAPEDLEKKMPAVVKKKVCSHVSFASVPNRDRAPSAEAFDSSPPPGNLSVRVQLYENELQPDKRECAEMSDSKMSAQDVGENAELTDLRQRLKVSMDSNASLASQVSTLQETNSYMTNLLRDKEATIAEAQATITTLQESSSATGNSKQTPDGRPELEQSVETEQLAVQNLKRQLEEAENLNEELQSRLSDTTSQKEKHAVELRESAASLQTTIEERNDLGKQLSALQTKHESTLSTSAKAVSELRETISNLESTMQKTETSNSQVVSELEKKVSKISAEREELAKKVETMASESASVHVDVSNLEKLQSEKEELTMKLDRANATLGTLKLESEVRLNRSETACTEKQKEIASLKQSASKRMSQVYQLTDQLSTALTEKAELAKTLESTAADLSELRDEAASQAAKISELESSLTSLSGMESSNELTRLEEEKADAVAKLKRLGGTVDKLQDRIRALSNQLSAASLEKAELETKLESTTADLTKTKDVVASQTAKMSELETSVASLTALRDAAKHQASQHSGSVDSYFAEQFARLETEKKEAVATSNSLRETVDELNGNVERLSSELNASKTKSDKLRSEVESLESRNQECLDELERFINKKDRSPPQMQTCRVSETADLMAQISALTSERDELKSRLEEASLRSAGAAESAARGQRSEDPFGTIISEKAGLVRTVGECISESEVQEMESTILGIRERIARARGNSHNGTNGIKHSQSGLNEALSQAKQLKKQLAEKDSDLSKLMSDAEQLEAHMKRTVQKFKDEYLVTTKDCKVKLRQKHKKISTLKADIASIKAISKKDLSTSKDPSPSVTKTDETSKQGADAPKKKRSEDGLGGNASQNDEDTSHVQLFAFDVTRELYAGSREGRPKRKLKAIARFESMSFDKKAAHCKIGEGFTCPRCSAVCSYDSKECDECHLSCYYEAGIGVVVLKERIVESERDTSLYHPAAQPASKKSKKTSHRRQDTKGTSNIAQEGGAKGTTPAVPPSWAWAKIEHSHLLPSGGQEYPRELPRVIDFIEAQCKKQEENAEASRREWSERCQVEAEAEAKAFDDERIAYKRGIRERSRMADQERLEKLRFIEKADEMMMRYEHEGGDKRFNKEDIESTKLCSRQIVFSKHHDSHLGENASTACMNEDCQFCMRNSVYRQNILLEEEINECKLGAPPTESLLLQKNTNVLNPHFRVIDAGYLSRAENDGTPGEDDTAKQLKVEEDKLEKLQTTKHRLEFIKNYNDGYVRNAWTRKDTLKRKSS